MTCPLLHRRKGVYKPRRFRAGSIRDRIATLIGG